jgi:hypothetical protein
VSERLPASVDATPLQPPRPPDIARPLSNSVTRTGFLPQDMAPDIGADVVPESSHESGPDSRPGVERGQEKRLARKGLGVSEGSTEERGRGFGHPQSNTSAERSAPPAPDVVRQPPEGGGKPLEMGGTTTRTGNSLGVAMIEANGELLRSRWEQPGSLNEA